MHCRFQKGCQSLGFKVLLQWEMAWWAWSIESPLSPLVLFIEVKKKFKSPENNQNYRVNFSHTSFAMDCYRLWSWKRRVPGRRHLQGYKRFLRQEFTLVVILPVIDWSVSETQCWLHITYAFTSQSSKFRMRNRKRNTGRDIFSAGGRVWSWWLCVGSPKEDLNA